MKQKEETENKNTAGQWVSHGGKVFSKSEAARSMGAAGGLGHGGTTTANGWRGNVGVMVQEVVCCGFALFHWVFCLLMLALMQVARGNAGGSGTGGQAGRVAGPGRTGGALDQVGGCAAGAVL